MSRTQKTLTVVLWGVVVCLAVTLLAAQLYMGQRRQPAPGAVGSAGAAPSHPDGDLPVLYEAPHFSLVDQNNRPVSDQSLRGQVWVAAFIFTQCAGPCPMMSSKMSTLQQMIEPKAVKLVSFTVDPERDTPEVLKAYAKKFHAEDARWHFLTGEKSVLFEVAAGMKLVAKPADAENAILHSTKFLLVDGQGRVRGIYDNAEEGDMERLARDASRLHESLVPSP